MSKKFKGLLLTEEIRKSLYLAVEEAIRCHASALERNIKSREKEARAERIHMYNDTAEACENMLETRAMDLLFSKYDGEDLLKILEQWEEKKYEESDHRGVDKIK